MFNHAPPPLCFQLETIGLKKIVVCAAVVGGADSLDLLAREVFISFPVQAQVEVRWCDFDQFRYLFLLDPFFDQERFKLVVSSWHMVVLLSFMGAYLFLGGGVSRA